MTGLSALARDRRQNAERAAAAGEESLAASSQKRTVGAKFVGAAGERAIGFELS
jgi:hypothetical protein